MNIGIVTTWFERGAAYVSKQLMDILKLEHNVYIYARGGEKYAISESNWDNKNVTWGEKTYLPVPMAINLSHFENWIKNTKLDIVIFNEQQWWEPVLLCNKLNVTTGSYIDYYTEDTIPLFGCFDFLICNTKRHYETFKWHPQVFYIPWGTDLNIYKPNSFFPVTEGHVTFFHSCGYSPERKGTDLLIEAFEKITGSAKLIIHSQIEITGVYPSLFEKINRMINEGRLIIIKDTIPSPGLYYMGDVYVYPSRLDGIGLTITEALACGLPVITSDNPPMNEFINERNGKLIKVLKLYSRSDGYYWPQCQIDINCLQENIQEYVNEKEKISLFKHAAREYAKENLDWSKNGKVLLSIILNVRKINYEVKLNYINMAKSYEKKRETLQQRYYLFFKLFYIIRDFFKVFKRIFM